MADTDTKPGESEETEDAPLTDHQREELLGQLTEHLGDALVASHIKPGDELWVRVTTEGWAEIAHVLRHSLNFLFFDFVSAIDWMPSPFGRDMDSEVDLALAAASGEAEEPAEPEQMVQGYTGGDTRFQVFSRVLDVENLRGLIIKADVPDSLEVPTWITSYPGAVWHEREVHEMYGISFAGNPDMRNLYLPGDFEGYPLRKDFPLLARKVKPWPGIVDVETIPGDGDDADGTDGAAESTEASE